jgi:3-hydroxyisobutyrate dehydrogenase-like beta-hydroxyacid dehydrogenase
MAQVALLGTGIIGAPMARNPLRAGHDVRVWNRTEEKAKLLDRALELGHGDEDMSAVYYASAATPAAAGS